MMMLIVFIGLITAIGLCIQRNAVEKQSTTIEQAMDFDAVVLMARNDGYDLDTALQMARDAGVTSFTIYDTTLNKRGTVAGYEIGGRSLLSPVRHYR